MRDPVYWLDSCYRHFKRHKMKMKHLYLKPQPCTFLDYVEELITLGDYKPCQSSMFIDQSSYVKLSSIGNYDYISHYFKYICSSLGLGASNELPHENKNVSYDRSTQIEVPSQIVSLIRKYWVNDCFLFDRIRGKNMLISSAFVQSLPLIPAVDLARYDPWGYMINS